MLECHTTCWLDIRKDGYVWGTSKATVAEMMSRDAWPENDAPDTDAADRSSSTTFHADLTDLSITNDWRSLLSETETELVECARRGATLDLRSAERASGEMIRARVIEVLALGERDDWPLHDRGIRLVGASIEGRLNLYYGKITVPIEMRYCLFSDPPVMRGASIPFLRLSGSQLPGLDAIRINVAGSVLLVNVVASDTIRLQAARIGGYLTCDGGRFAALNAERATVGDAMSLRDGFEATALVTLHGAHIGANLQCDGGRFHGQEQRAIDAASVTVGDSVLLTDGFAATGQVSLYGARIGGDFDCRGGRFSAIGHAIDAQGMTVADTWVLKDATFDHGSVNVAGASVGRLVDACVRWPVWYGDGFAFGDFSGDASTDVDERIKWLQGQGGDFRPSPYTHLSEVFRRRGDINAARSVLIAREEHRIKTLAPLWRRRLHHLWGTVSAYGYRPWRAVGWLAGLIAVAGMVFWFTPMQQVVEHPLLLRPLLYAADLAIPLVDLRQASQWQPASSWGQLFMAAVISLGWVLSGAFVAAITGVFTPND